MDSMLLMFTLEWQIDPVIDYKSTGMSLPRVSAALEKVRVKN